MCQCVMASTVYQLWQHKTANKLLSSELLLKRFSIPPATETKNTTLFIWYWNSNGRDCKAERGQCFTFISSFSIFAFVRPCRLKSKFIKFVISVLGDV